MIVWLPSYPRSGNTFFRILLHHLYGVPTYTGFLSGDDLELDVGAGSLTGYSLLPPRLAQARRSKDPLAVLDEFDASDALYFIKTHNRNDELFDTKHRAILLVRDARDAFVSVAWYMLQVEGAWRRLGRRIVAGQRHHLSRLAAARRLLTDVATAVWINSYKAVGRERRLFEKVLRERVVPDDRWSRLYFGWAERPACKTAVVKFEDLLVNPAECAARALGEVGVELQPQGGRVPTFAELKQVHPQFFRKGTVGGWRADFPPDSMDVFWKTHGAAMRALGYQE